MLQNNDPDGAVRNLRDSEIDELVRFFQLLDVWDREAKSTPVP